jgi:hypothetical protein
VADDIITELEAAFWRASSEHAELLHRVRDEIAQLRADLAEAQAGWNKACEYNRNASAEIRRQNERIIALRSELDWHTAEQSRGA